MAQSTDFYHWFLPKEIVIKNYTEKTTKWQTEVSIQKARLDQKAYTDRELRNTAKGWSESNNA